MQIAKIIYRSLAMVFFFTINSLFCFAPVQSQQFSVKPIAAYPKGYFRNPLDIPIKLAANFGELRTNHYHMGFDIRTNQRENLPVYAAAEGYISKVKIEKSGFGRAIYITHPNGFTTLYAHLNAFFPALGNYVVNKQYDDQKWEQEFNLSPSQFPVSKGQFIAYSGNTGGSAGPHLHFEIRDTRSGNNLNPWLFDMGLADNIPPVLYRLYYFDRQKSTYEAPPIPIAIKGGAGKYTSASDVVSLSSPYISFGITAEDKTTPSSFNFGIFETVVAIDDTVRSSFKLNDISYNDTRYLNAGIDYKTRLSGGAYIQHLSRLPGNKLSIFNEAGNGTFLIKDEAVHTAKIDIKDAAGNLSELNFSFKYNGKYTSPPAANVEAVVLSPGIENVFATENVVAAFSPRAFYDTVHFIHKMEAARVANAVSPTHKLHNYTVPVHDSFTVRIQPDVIIAEGQQDRVVMKMVSNRKVEIEKGNWKNGWMEAKFRDLGNFTLLLDTVPPTISLVGWANGSNLSGRTGFTIAASDNLGDVKNASGYVNGEWILFSKKDNRFIHTFDGRITSGKHELKIVAEDEAGNTLEKIVQFTR